MNRTYSRFPYRKTFGYLFFIIAVLLMSWESQHADAALAKGQIPEESIRLRILANSDSAADQAVKRFVRDAVVEAMNTWISEPQTIEQARSTIHAHLGEIESIVANELHKRGFTYGFKVELGLVPFPTKMYGNTVYPAGDYEALRISLGEAEGQNWWCVLFPPLCFVDSVSGEATAASADGTAVQVNEAAAANAAAAPEQPEVKFFLWEIIEAIINFFKNLF